MMTIQCTKVIRFVLLLLVFYENAIIHAIPEEEEVDYVFHHIPPDNQNHNYDDDTTHYRHYQSNSIDNTNHPNNQESENDNTILVRDKDTYDINETDREKECCNHDTTTTTIIIGDPYNNMTSMLYTWRRLQVLLLESPSSYTTGTTSTVISQWIVPLYTVLVLCYTTALLVQKHILLPKQQQQQQTNYIRPRTKEHIYQERILPSDQSRIDNDDGANIATNTSSNTVGDVQPIPQQSTSSQQSSVVEQPIDMSGTYQMTAHENLDAFLAIQGVPWPLRRAASVVYPVHVIVQQQNQLSITIEAKSSGFVTQTQYIINGPPVETNVRGRIFSDRVYYSYEDQDDNSNTTGTTIRKCNGIITEKRAITEGYIVIVVRKLVTVGNNENAVLGSGTTSNATTTENGGSQNENIDPQLSSSSSLLPQSKVQIHMTSTVSFPNEPNKKDIVCIQLFDRIGS
jgi:hypothetical protein